MVLGCEELGGSVRQLVLLVLLFILRLRRYRTGSRVLLAFRRPTCFGVRSK